MIHWSNIYSGCLNWTFLDIFLAWIFCIFSRLWTLEPQPLLSVWTGSIKLRCKVLNKNNHFINFPINPVQCSLHLAKLLIKSWRVLCWVRNRVRKVPMSVQISEGQNWNYAEIKTNKFFPWEWQIGQLYTDLISNPTDTICSTMHIYYAKYTKLGKYWNV